MLRATFLLFITLIPVANGQSRYDRFAVVLEDPPLAEQAFTARQEGRHLAEADTLARIRSRQAEIGGILERRKVRVVGATQRFLNAVYVLAKGAEADQLRSLPGVRRVVRLAPVKRALDRAVELVQAPEAWNILGGIDNAGEGVRIGILDTGIDHEHPAFQDASLTPPPGYPKCIAEIGECEYTNNKIIAARSYVDLLVLASVPEISRPDDVSPRDRVGHGTAVASVAAGARVTGPSATISGVAPKAFLGNYKIFGSPGVNDVTFGDVIAQALEDAYVDGMDIAVLPVGRPAEWGPDDDFCGDTANQPCDPLAWVVENAVRSGLAVVVPAGNSGDLTSSGSRFPALNSINSPGTAPSAITVGATTNAHVFFASVRVTGEGVPSGLGWMATLFGDGPVPGGPFTAPLRDTGATEPNAKACAPVGNGTLTGSIALIDRGDCSFTTKVNNAQQGGASAAIIINDANFVFPMTGLIDTGIPAVMLGSVEGQALRSFIAENPGREGTLDPSLEALNAPSDEVAYFTSRGPSIRDHLIKPELSAVGTDLYVATQQYDPNGDMWDPSGFTGAQGTSFAAPMAAGVAALVKQVNLGFGPAELKSAVTNTTTTKDQLADFDEGGAMVPVSVTAVGAGKLNAAQAIRTTVVTDPATLSFGVIDGTLPDRTLRVTNTANTAVQLTLSLEPADSRVTLGTTLLNLAPGASEIIQVSINETPPAGRYEGYVLIQGGDTAVRVPFLYLRGDGIPFNVVALSGVDFVGNVNELIDFREFNLSFKVVDRYGAPVEGAGIQFRVTKGGGEITEALDATDELGIGAATAVLGPSPGEHEFTAELDNAPDLKVYFQGRAKLLPVINVDGAVNAASGTIAQGLAPGSYISIYGLSLSDAFRLFSTPYLPVSLAGVSVSFDIEGRGISLPGRLHFVSDRQVNVQIPWELQGTNEVLMKISTGSTTESALYRLPLNDYAPGFFEVTDIAGSGRVIIAALDEDYQLISSANPAPRGRVVQLFANGVGPVNSPPPSGEPTPFQQIRTIQTPQVTIGGQASVVQFSGLSPGSIALYQVNVLVPNGLQPGLYEVILTIGGVQAKAGFLYVGE